MNQSDSQKDKRDDVGDEMSGHSLLDDRIVKKSQYEPSEKHPVFHMHLFGSGDRFFQEHQGTQCSKDGKERHKLEKKSRPCPEVSYKQREFCGGDEILDIYTAE